MNAVDHAQELIERGGTVHLIGAGGMGMAGVAFLLKERGFIVSGCDVQENRQTAWLQKKGINIFLGHHESHINKSVDWLVRSTAVPDTHPEVQCAKKLGIPVSRRGGVLPALMRNHSCIAVSGTHGKTTTTAMIAQVLGCGYCIGGEMVDIEGLAKSGEVMVVEADESDGTIVGYSPDFTVITNIEYDHMEHHASAADFIDCFKQLIKNTKQKVYYGADDPISVQLCSENPKCESFSFPTFPLSLPLPGNHNQWNAAATLAVSRTWKTEAEIFKALEKMNSIRRRFETVFERDGIRIVSDYAHHPTEIAALIQTALELKPKRLLGIFQPHRYTRTLALGPDFPPSFQGVEKLGLVPVYAASESPIEGGTTSDLRARFSEEWDGRLFEFQTLELAWAEILSQLREGDLLLLMGAGDIEQMAEWARQHR